MKNKHYEIIMAWAEGKKIQLMTGKGWQDWVGKNSPHWTDDSEYRIKPELKPEQAKEFRDIPVNGLKANYILRFYPSDAGWVCGISNQTMDALEVKK
jgi:hypothetical protein